MKIVQRKVWVTELTCCTCGQKEDYHHGEEGKPSKYPSSDYPSSGVWNGWDLAAEKCFTCKDRVNPSWG